jgi:hypothetical protein
MGVSPKTHWKNKPKYAKRRSVSQIGNTHRDLKKKQKKIYSPQANS